jgi:hypothetical protein
MDSAIDIPTLLRIGFPIQRSPGQSLLSGSPKLIAANHVFLRHPAPRHPPFALNSLAIIIHLFISGAKLNYPFSFFKEQFGLTPWAQGSKLKAESTIRTMNFQLWAFNLEPSSGGGERDRTDDLLRAKQVLSQLSYTP